jgi:hypothetical protein
MNTTDIDTKTPTEDLSLKYLRAQLRSIESAVAETQTLRLVYRDRYLELCEELEARLLSKHVAFSDLLMDTIDKTVGPNCALAVAATGQSLATVSSLLDYVRAARESWL